MVLTAVYVVAGTIDSFENIALKFRVGANHPWVHLIVAFGVAIGVPLAILGLGVGAFWVASLMTRAARNISCLPRADR
jgi:hypothetical protein